MNLGYRLVSAEDKYFLYQLHRATMREYVEETWGKWDEDWQLAYFNEHFQAQDMQIIQLDGTDIGVISVQIRTEELFIGIVEILPVFQRRGIGTIVVQSLLERAAKEGKAVALKVLKANRSARSLYQRLGFGVTGETETHYLLAWMNDTAQV